MQEKERGKETSAQADDADVDSLLDWWSGADGDVVDGKTADDAVDLDDAAAEELTEARGAPATRSTATAKQRRAVADPSGPEQAPKLRKSSVKASKKSQKLSDKNAGEMDAEVDAKAEVGPKISVAC